MMMRYLRSACTGIFQRLYQELNLLQASNKLAENFCSVSGGWHACLTNDLKKDIKLASAAGFSATKRAQSTVGAQHS